MCYLPWNACLVWKSMLQFSNLLGANDRPGTEVVELSASEGSKAGCKRRDASACRGSAQ